DKLRADVRDTLRSTGATDAEITNLWQSGAIRHHGTQRLFVEAALYRQAQARAREVQNKRVPLPPVQSPGVARPRGAGGAEMVRSLQSQLANAKGNQSVKIAAELTRAKRAAGLL